jgi:ectoine hydroxylase-related dioxygenase (phytanoyl-CoA dioxygenase family)
MMSRILAIRLHLDDCFAANGALKVLPGSHRSDALTSDRIEEISSSVNEVVCEVPAGGAVLMSPLLLHASSPMINPGHRRVIHLEFTAQELPQPLEWRYRMPCE